MLSETLGSQELTELAAFLRAHNFAVGTAQLLAAQRLLWRMAEQGTTKSVPELAPWLGPIFATNPHDSERFAELYVRWQSPPPQPEPPDPKSRRLVSLAAALIIAALMIGLYIYHHYPSQSTKNQGTPVQPPSAVPSREPTGSAGNVTAEGLLRGSDGKAVAHARLLFDGKDLESSGDGSFTINGKSSTPVLAIHCDYDAILFPLVSGGYPHQMIRKAQSACTYGNGGSVPSDPRPEYRRIRLGVSAIPMIAFVFWAAYVFYKRIGLRKWNGAASSAFAQLPVGEWTERLFSETELERSVQELRRPRPTSLFEVWPEPTVAATVENAGWFTPIYRARQRSAEYLVLIERTGKRDQQAHFADELLKSLKERGVYTHLYYFNSDPRTCIEAEGGRIVSITDLSARFGQCQVWIVAESHTFFSAFTGRLERWVDVFQQWPTRVLLTPADPSGWGEREFRLADFGFELLPASPRGLARIVEHLTASEMTLDSYPLLLEERPIRWTSNEPPTRRETIRLCTELRLYLGTDGYRWLSACAEYPLIEWPLTLHLGNVLMPPGTLGSVLRKLVRLPWFRRGSMPQWLRISLLRDRELRKRVHRLFVERLGALPVLSPKRTTTNEVEVAIERDYQRRVHEDEIWVSLLWGRDPGSLVLPLPTLRRLLFEKGHVWLGPRLSLLFTTAVLMSFGTWWMIGFGVPKFVPPQPGIERIALDIAFSQYHDTSYYKASYDSDRPIQFPDWCYRITQLVLGRSISLTSATSQTELIPGAVSRRNAEEGLYAGGGWSLAFQEGHIVPQKNYSIYQLAALVNGAPSVPLPPAPPVETRFAVRVEGVGPPKSTAPTSQLRQAAPPRATPPKSTAPTSQLRQAAPSHATSPPFSGARTQNEAVPLSQQATGEKLPAVTTTATGPEQGATTPDPTVSAGEVPSLLLMLRQGLGHVEFKNDGRKILCVTSEPSRDPRYVASNDPACPYQRELVFPKRTADACIECDFILSVIGMNSDKPVPSQASSTDSRTSVAQTTAQIRPSTESEPPKPKDIPAGSAPENKATAPDSTEADYTSKLSNDEHQFGATSPQVADDLRDLATFYVSRGKYEQAEPLLMRSLTIAEKTRNTGSEVSDLSDLGRIAMILQRYEDAEKFYRQALSLVRELGSLQGEMTLLTSLGALFFAEKRLSEAEFSYSEARAIAKKILGQLPSDRQRAISSKLAVLRSLPQSARSRRLDDPNFTRGMSENDKVLLRDLSEIER
jgi:hypothetical protein